MDAWELTAREQIRDLLARYTWAGDRGRIDDLASLFTTQGVLDLGDHGGRLTGPAAIRAGLEQVTERLATAGPGGGPIGLVQHHVASIQITEVSGAGASVRSYYAVHTAVGLDHWGRYFDRLELEVGRWRFAQRMVLVDGAHPDSLVVAR